MVRFQTTLAGSSAIACETRATPRLYAIERSSRVFSGALETTSSLPPRCINSVRSETCSTSTPSSARTASTMRSRCPLSDASTLTSRIFFPCSTRTRWIDFSQSSGLADRLGEEGAKQAGLVHGVHPECRAEGGGRMRRSAHGFSVVVVA